MSENTESHEADLKLVKEHIEAIEAQETEPEAPKPAKKATKKAAKKPPKKVAKKAAPAPSAPKRLPKGTKIIDPFTPHSRRVVTVIDDSLNTAGYRRITIQDQYGAIVQRNIAGMKPVEVVENV